MKAEAKTAADIKYTKAKLMHIWRT